MYVTGIYKKYIIALWNFLILLLKVHKHQPSKDQTTQTQARNIHAFTAVVELPGEILSFCQLQLIMNHQDRVSINALPHGAPGPGQYERSASWSTRTGSV